MALAVDLSAAESSNPVLTPHPDQFTHALPEAFAIHALPGCPPFVFTMYGMPGDLASLKQLVQLMKDFPLGNGFDPGPFPDRNSQAVFDYLAGIGWPVVAYPGADMQVKGGRGVLGPDNLAALSAFDRAGVFSAVQLGEWDYYFHNLSDNESWWRANYGNAYDEYKHLMKPPGLAGYDHPPTSRRECYDVLEDYFKSRCHDLLGRVISVTGHGHYEAYAGEWGARCVGLEVGENIAFTQSKLAFARGAARQWHLPWSVQVSPWFSGACTTSGPLRKEGNDARGLDAGHSLSFYERMWLHGWFSGASMVTPENSIAIFFETQAQPWTLTPHGHKASEVFQFMLQHDRGMPYTPVAILIDHLAGYNGYMDKPWGILEPTTGDRELRDLFDYQLFPGGDFRHHPYPDDPETGYLRPTPYGEIFDVQLTSASEKMLGSYQVILLAGDIQADNELITKLESALKGGSRLLLSQEQKTMLGREFSRLAAFTGVEVLEAWTNPETGRGTAISSERLSRLVSETLPIEVSADHIQYAINRSAAGWVVELINDSGILKKPDQPAVIDPTAIAHVVLRPHIRYLTATEWKSQRQFTHADELTVDVGPGQSAFVEFTGP